MKLLVNGRPRVVDPGTTLQDLAPAPRGVAIAVNGAVVPAAAWPDTVLSEEDAVEIVTAQQGG